MILCIYSSSSLTGSGRSPSNHVDQHHRLWSVGLRQCKKKFFCESDISLDGQFVAWMDTLLTICSLFLYFSLVFDFWNIRILQNWMWNFVADFGLGRCSQLSRIPRRKGPDSCSSHGLGGLSPVTHSVTRNWILVGNSIKMPLTQLQETEFWLEIPSNCHSLSYKKLNSGWKFHQTFLFLFFFMPKTIQSLQSSSFFV
jgi:hypothetical protein